MAGVFISYRRSDSAGHTGRLADDLSEGLEEQQLFRDIEAIEAGEDFVEALNRAVGACSVMLVIIGPTWAKVETGDGKRRLHQEGDFVRMEIETALARQVRVIPVLVGDAQMPQPDDLPESLQPLLRRNAYMVSDRRWQYDIDRLLDILEKVPGIASRKKHDGDAPLLAAQPPSPPKGMATWMKVAIGSGATVVASIAIMLLVGKEPEETPVQTASAAALPVSPPPSAGNPLKEFVGFWRSEDNFFYDIAQDGDGLTVVSGDAVDPANSAEPTTTNAPTKAGVELVGKAAVTGRALEVTLTDSFSNATETMSLTLSNDGRTLEGTLTAGGDPPVRAILRRQ